ncbi:hypothetical protein ACIPEL_18200 [Streptomyces griseoviridis]
MLGIIRLHNRPKFRLPQHLVFVKAELVLDPEFDSRMPSDNVGPRLGRHPAKAQKGFRRADIPQRRDDLLAQPVRRSVIVYRTFRHPEQAGDRARFPDPVGDELSDFVRLSRTASAKEVWRSE